VQHVEDKDLGFRDMVKAAAKLDGLELRNGILDHTLRYPKTPGAKGTEISKVAAMLGVFRAIGGGYDSQAGVIDAAMDQILKDVHHGRHRPAQRIHQLIGLRIQAAQRASLSGVISKRTGRMWKAIRSTVFEAGKIGARRGSAARGTVAAGDDPKRPRATDGV